MKRSEALKVIKDVLIGGYDYPEQVILTKLEDLGMLPPTVEVEESIGYPDEEGNELFQVILVNEWERE